jgi:hypothetical protein
VNLSLSREGMWVGMMNERHASISAEAAQQEHQATRSRSTVTGNRSAWVEGERREEWGCSQGSQWLLAPACPETVAEKSVERLALFTIETD